MGEIVPLSLGIRSNPARNRQAGNGRLINCFAEEQGEEGKSVWAIYGIEGLANFGVQLDGGGIRELLEVKQRLIAAAGQRIHAVDLGGGASNLGGVATSGHLYMRTNRREPSQVGIVSDGLYYKVDDLVLSQVQDADLPAPTSLAYLDGYGILPGDNAGFMITGLDDFSTIDGLDEGICDSTPKPIVRVQELGREVYFFKETNTEVHVNTGDADFPFEREQTVEIGCLAPRSVAIADTPEARTLFWVAPDHTVRQLAGYSARVVSTNEVSKLIRTLAVAGRANELVATAWAASGRFFYSLSCADWTRCLDTKTGAWHERRSHGLNRWRVSHVSTFGSKLIAGDYANGQLYEMNETFFDEAGNYLVSEIIAPPVHAYPYDVRFNALYVDAAVGVGLNSASVFEREPKMIFDYSDDDGFSFTGTRGLALGTVGQPRPIPPINGLGCCGPKGRHFRFRIPAPVEKVIMSVMMDMDVLET